MKWYDDWFLSMYAFSSRTTVDGQPDLYSTWLMLSGIQTMNALSVLCAYVLVSEGDLDPPLWLLLAAASPLFVLNGVYIARRGRKKLNAVSRQSHRMAAIYIAASVSGLFGVVALMFIDVLSR